uniref:Uncharacterized protein n=1 Tax=Rhizophora mucronata TaxID=61149 RepID=A0A2P2NR71_RHIMU
MSNNSACVLHLRIDLQFLRQNCKASLFSITIYPREIY